MRLLRTSWWILLTSPPTARFLAQAQPVPVAAPTAVSGSSPTVPPVVVPGTPGPAPTAATGNAGSTTFGPTLTWSPTITPLPTITAFPTYTDCNVCGPGGNVTLPDEILELPTLNNITCLEAQTAGAMGEVPQNTCQFLQLFVFDNNLCGCQNRAVNITAPPTIAPTQAFPACYLCASNNSTTDNDGEEEYQSIQNPSATLQFGNATVHCSFAEEAGRNGLWNPEVCLALQNVSAPVCGCGPALAPTDDEPTADDQEMAGPCYLCGGPGYEFLHPEAQIPVPFELTQALEGIVVGEGEDFDPFRCGTLEGFQDESAWSPLVCSFLQSTGAAVCGCQEVEATDAPMASPTSTTTPSGKVPTVAVAPVPTSGTGSDNGDEAPPTAVSAALSSMNTSPWLVVFVVSASSTALGLLFVLDG